MYINDDDEDNNNNDKYSQNCKNKTVWLRENWHLSPVFDRILQQIYILKSKMFFVY